MDGFRCGVLHTFNKDLIAAIEQISMFQSVPPVIQVSMVTVTQVVVLSSNASFSQSNKYVMPFLT